MTNITIDGSFRRALGTAGLIAMLGGALTVSTAVRSADAQSALEPCGTFNAAALDPRPIPESLGGAHMLDLKDGFKFPATALGAPEPLPATWYNAVKVTPEEAKAICEKHLTAVFLDWSGVPLNLAIRSGIKEVFDALGIKLLRVADYSFNSNGLTGVLAAMLPLHPDILITGGTVSPAQFAAVLKPALDQGVTVVAWSLGSPTLKVGQNEPIKAIVAMDFFNLGAQMADAAHKEWPNGANLGYIHWINNAPPILARETGFLDELKKYPNIHIITNGVPSPTNAASGYSNPSSATAFTEAFLTGHPQVNVLFAPWEDPPALGEAAAIKALHLENKVKIVTEDLGNQGAYQLKHNGIIAVDIAEDVYDGGRLMALSAALARIGKDTHPYVMVPTYPVTPATDVKAAWDFMHGPEVPCPPSDCQ